MKIAELRALLKQFSEEELRIIIAEIYKTIPKKIKEEKDIDDLIQNPQSSRKRKKKPKTIDFYKLQEDVKQFIRHAYSQYYFAPNSVVHKKERPKWRFKVKAFYKELIQASEIQNYTVESAHLMKELYDLLCYGCEYIIFSTDDVFNSIGISQVDFFRSVLDLKIKHESTTEFVRGSIALMAGTVLNRETLHVYLMYVILEF